MVDVAWQRLPMGSVSYPSEVLISNSLDYATSLTPPTAKADPIILARTTTTISFSVQIIHILVVHMESYMNPYGNLDSSPLMSVMLDLAPGP